MVLCVLELRAAACHAHFICSLLPSQPRSASCRSSQQVCKACICSIHRHPHACACCFAYAALQSPTCENRCLESALASSCTSNTRHFLREPVALLDRRDTSAQKDCMALEQGRHGSVMKWSMGSLKQGRDASMVFRWGLAPLFEASPWRGLRSFFQMP